MSKAENGKIFFYFGFGSNLLTKRIQIQNPSAKRYSSGVVTNYRLDFHGHASRWNGATATIVEDEGEVVWGAIWTIDSSHMKHLDRQEGVLVGKYQPIYIPVITPDNKMIECRAYQLVTNQSGRNRFSKQSNSYLSVILAKACRAYQLINNPSSRNHRFSKPSKTYLSVILAGAKESGLPEEYIRRLETIENNGQLAYPKMLETLGSVVN